MSDVICTLVGILVVAGGLAWAINTHTGDVSQVEQCEARGGVMALGARGYLCLRPEVLK